MPYSPGPGWRREYCDNFIPLQDSSGEYDEHGVPCVLAKDHAPLAAWPYHLPEQSVLPPHSRVVHGRELEIKRAAFEAGVRAEPMQLTEEAKEMVKWIRDI